VHVVDAYDAMTSDRPYRRGMSSELALATLRRFSGTQFDPQVVEVFTRLQGANQSLQRLSESVAAEQTQRSVV
jgi:HD-GYP domain-containing protein (c-di-GMP phosphodiesterase class II)